MNSLLMSDNIRKRLHDPFVAEWALRTLENEKKVDAPGVTEAERFLFDDAAMLTTIRRLLATDDRKTLTRMFATLSPERFQSVADMLIECWPAWQDTVACWSAPVMARVAPDAAARLFGEYIASHALDDDFNKTAGVLRGIGLLHSPAGRDLAQKMMPLRVDDAQGLLSPFDMLEAIRLAWTHELPILDDLLIDLVTAPGKVTLANKMLPRVYRVLTNGLPFYDHIVDLRDGKTKQTFASLAPLFEPGAPLGELDRLVSQSRPADIGDAFVFLCMKCEGRDYRPLAMARRVMAERAAPVQHEVKTAMAQFFLGIGAASWLPTSGEYSHLSLEECVRAMASDISTMPNYDALLSNIRTHPSERVATVILQELVEAKEHCGAIHLAKLMGDLALDTFIPSLIGLLEEDSGDIVCEEAIIALSRFGKEAERAILDSWMNLAPHQRLWCLNVLEKVGGEATIAHLVNVFPEMRNEWLESWCETAMAAPDTRLLDVLDPELRRKHLVIDKTYALLSAVLDETRETLPDVRERVQAASRRKAEQRQTLGLDRVGPSVLHMKLHCRACGDTNVYDVRNVFISPEAPTEPPYIGDDLACLSCGERDSLDMAGTGSFALTAELIRIGVAKQAGKEIETPLKFLTGKLADGQLLPVGRAIEHYKEAIEKDPGSLVDMLSLGNCYETVGRRRQAEECFRKCVHMDPTCPEAAYALALILRDSGRRRDAFQVLDAALKHKGHWRFYRLTDSRPREFIEAFLDLHDELAPGSRRSAPALPMTHFAAIAEEARPFAAKAFAAKGGNREKVSPNAPCPCGSGKKFKKCCGRTA